jgi:chromosome segregation ATPase
MQDFERGGTMTLSDIEILQSTLRDLSKQVQKLSEENRVSFNHIHDRLTRIETQMSERECQFKRYEKQLENHEVRIRTVEGELGTLRDVPERLWRVSMSNSKLTGMIAAAGGMGGLVATLISKILGE